MQNLLFLAHRIPYPPNKGDKIRSWNILRHLAKDYRIFLGCFIDDRADRKYGDLLQSLCAEFHFSFLNPNLATLRSTAGLFTGRPLSLGYYRDRSLQNWVSNVLARQKIDRVFIFSSSMAQYAPRNKIGSARLVVDFVDVDSDKWRQFSNSKPWPASWIYGREGRTLLAYEREVAAEADAGLFVSADEADLFRQLAPESESRIRFMNNGVDFEYFDPEGDYPTPFPAGKPTLVFTGAMDYWANVDAVCWFAREEFPTVRVAHPDIEFCIVGSNPASAVRALASLPGVTVTGRVEDVRPYIAHAAAVVAPLRLARGVQNKVLEAMAMAKPVVVTAEALEGIDAAPGSEVLLAGGPGTFAKSVLDALERRDLKEIGQRARARVIGGYGWDDNLSVLKGIFEN